MQKIEKSLSVLQQSKRQVEQDLAAVFDQFQFTPLLKKATYHAVMSGGKRVRPALCYAAAQLSAQACGGSTRRAAVAVELIHCYSLVHDDLPCMDDDVLRRGQPTCHTVYGEANALLAGDVLQSVAMQVLTATWFNTEPHDAALSEKEKLIAFEQVAILSDANTRMVCGQVLDLQSEDQLISDQDLRQIHQNKTGALIQAALLLGVASVGLGQNEQVTRQMIDFGQALGLAFQVQDDILDVISNAETLGKNVGMDAKLNKATYPALMGLKAAQVYAEQLHDQAIKSLDCFGVEADALRQLARQLLTRNH